ncbi:MAG: type II secretion system F family protein, partial [Verrucomicrobiota bacterium]
MSKFQFVALDNAGKERKGMVEAQNREMAITQIKGYGLTPARVSQVRAGQGSGGILTRDSVKAAAPVRAPVYFGSAINDKALSVFTRQLATLLRAGLPLIRALETLLAQEKNKVFQWVLSQQVDNIRSGNTFSEGLAKFPKEFSKLFLNMVKAGEASGTLDLALDRLANFLLKMRQIKTKMM